VEIETEREDSNPLPKTKADNTVIIVTKENALPTGKACSNEDLLNLIDYYENKRQYFMEKAYDGETILKYWIEQNITK
jgi:hypothetical protein